MTTKILCNPKITTPFLDLCFSSNNPFNLKSWLFLGCAMSCYQWLLSIFLPLQLIILFECSFLFLTYTLFLLTAVLSSGESKHQVFFNGLKLTNAQIDQHLLLSPLTSQCLTWFYMGRFSRKSWLALSKTTWSLHVMWYELSLIWPVYSRWPLI